MFEEGDEGVFIVVWGGAVKCASFPLNRVFRKSRGVGSFSLIEMNRSWACMAVL